MPFFKRYFLGGATNLRGWGRFDVSPLSGSGPADRRPDDHELLDRAARCRCSASLGGVVFLDGGNVWRDPWDFNFNDMRYDVGPGLRYDTPIGPIRIDLGYQLNPIPGLLGERRAGAAPVPRALQHRPGVLRRSRIMGDQPAEMLDVSVARCRSSPWSAPCWSGIVALALIVSQTPWFRDWLRRYVVRESKQYLNGELSIGGLSGNLLFGVGLTDVAVDVSGQRVVAVKALQVDYSVFQILSSGIIIDEIKVIAPTHRASSATRTAGTWRRLVKKQARGSGPQGAGPADLAAVDRAHRRHGGDRRQGRLERVPAAVAASTACTSRASSSTRRCTTPSSSTTCGSAAPRRT